MKLYFLIIIIIFIILLGGFFLWQGIYLPKEADLVQEKLFSVERGQGIKEISLNLENQELIRHRLLFQLYTFVKGISPELQAGLYSLSPSMSVSEIADKIVRGDILKKRVTIPEGFNIRQIERRFSEIFGREMDFAKFSKEDFQADFDFLRDVDANKNLEGFLFPDTYQFSYLASEKEIVKEMLENFNNKLTSEIRGEIAQQGKSIFEIVIMASLLEEEVMKFEDKKLASGIFWKRINIGKPLQSCATIAYILQGEDWTFREMRREIGKGKKIDSPYNTYMYRGLPIGPISNPGLESIIAAVFPKDNQYWYFLSTPEGETIFSKTLQEHNIAKAKYLK